MNEVEQVTVFMRGQVTGEATVDAWIADVVRWLGPWSWSERSTSGPYLPIAGVDVNTGKAFRGNLIMHRACYCLMQLEAEVIEKYIKQGKAALTSVLVDLNAGLPRLKTRVKNPLNCTAENLELSFSQRSVLRRVELHKPSTPKAALEAAMENARVTVANVPQMGGVVETSDAALAERLKRAKAGSGTMDDILRGQQDTLDGAK